MAEDTLEQVSCSSFPRFPELPTEIRLQVWRDTFPGDVDPTKHHRIVIKFRGDDIITTATPPLVFHINHESRSEALRYYQLLFDNIEGVHPMYYNPELDTIALCQYYPRCFTYLAWLDQGLIWFRRNCPGQLEAIQALEVVSRDFDYTNVKQEETRLRQFFPRLRFLNIVKHARWFESDDTYFYYDKYYQCVKNTA